MYVPSAEEYYSKTLFPTLFKHKPDEIKLWFETNPDAQQSVNIMIEFAKLHVQAALEAANENLEYTDQDSSISYVIESSILNAYPLENIK